MMADHVIEIDGTEDDELEEGRDQTSTLLMLTNKLKQEIMHDIGGLRPLQSDPCIFRVHEGLRQGNEKAYTPVLVSIGPYHHGNRKLASMEEHKRRYLNSLLIRTSRSVDHYIVAMAKLEKRARNCYADPIEHRFKGSDEFVRMMLVDACFIMEFLRRWEQLPNFQDKADPIFTSSWMISQICRDLILLENQIPFFVLIKLFEMNYRDLRMLAKSPINAMLPEADYFLDRDYIRGNYEISHLHFLDLVHKGCIPRTGYHHENEFQSQSQSQSQSDHERCCMPFLLDLMRNKFCFPKSTSALPSEYESKSNHQISEPFLVPADSRSKSSNTACLKMPCVVNLQEAGVNFSAHVGDKVGMFDITFNCGQLQIPKFQVSDFTEIFLRNVIAYEQHSSSSKPQFFTDYTYFMDLLINSKEDVNILRRCKIIDSMLGDDKMVAHLFNNLCEGTITSTKGYYYSKLCKQVNEHYDNCWNQVMANLRHNYFNSPWASFATIAAGFLLILTVIQTVAALIPLFA